MKIVVLDGHVANPGDLGWDGLAALGPLEVHPRTPAELVKERAAGANVVLTNKVVLDRNVLSTLPDLRLVSVLATGTNVVDLRFAKERGVTVCNVPGYSTASVAQMTFALLLELTHHVGQHSDGVRRGRWSESPDFAYWDTPLVELEGLTLGIVGYGAIGRRVAEIAKAFGMHVLVHTRTPRTVEGIRFVDPEQLFRESDVISLHCPLHAATEHFVNAERLELMKPTAFILNTGRGGLVDEAALAEALATRRIAGAAVDVLSAEPPPRDNPLLRAPNCIVTPHIAWATRAARQRLLQITFDNVSAFLAGRAINVCNP